MIAQKLIIETILKLVLKKTRKKEKDLEARVKKLEDTACKKCGKEVEVSKGKDKWYDKK